MPLVVRESSSGFDDALRALLDAIQRHGLTVFSIIDHAAGAREAGLELEDETVVLFGNPQAGTPLMQEDRRIGIELPLRILVWRAGGRTFLGHHDLAQLTASYDVSRHAATVAAMSNLLDELSSG